MHSREGSNSMKLLRLEMPMQSVNGYSEGSAIVSRSYCRSQVHVDILVDAKRISESFVCV